MSNLPEIAQLEFDTTIETTSQPRGKSFLFNFQTGQLVLQNGKMVEVSGLDALKIWIEKTLRTARDRFVVYKDTDYGTSIESLIGLNYQFNNFIQEEIQRQTTEALEQHEEINSIADWQFVRDGSNMTISFTVNSVYGASRQEVRF